MFKMQVDRLPWMQFRQVADRMSGLIGTARILAATADALAQQIAWASQISARRPCVIHKATLAGADH
ncbi:hypothetical protein WDV93_18760 [Pantoea ananatis]